MRACFRCDASAAIGSGHVMRCLTLADALRRMGWECIFHTSRETPQVVPALAQSGYRIIHDAAEAGQVDVLIFDHYHLAQEHETPCRAWAKKLLVIDDLADRHHDCDMLLDQTYGRAASDYAPLVPTDCRVLTGARYALLRPQFAAARTASLARRQAGQVQRVLIATGTTNLHNSTGIVLEMLMPLTTPLKIDVVLGSAANQMQQVQAVLQQLNTNSPHHATLHVDVQDMASLMAETDLAIGAGGTTSWERCCLGLPAIILELANNQKPTAKALHDAGAVVNLGDVTLLQGDALRKVITDMTAQPEKMQAMQQAAAAICDGLGADTVAAYLQPELRDKQGAPIRLRDIHMQDAEQVYAWQTHADTRRFFRNQSIPSYDEHHAWMRKITSDDTRQAYIILCGEQPCGVLRLDAEPQGYEISIYTAPEMKQRGIAGQALALASRLYAGAVFLAEVLPENAASKALFEGQGFTHFQGNIYRKHNPEGERA